MKKIFIAWSVLAALTFGASYALAVPGVPDNQPGTDLKIWFLVSEARYTTDAGPTTLWNLSEVKGLKTTLLLDFYTTKSVYVDNTYEELTGWATEMIDVNKYIKGMSTAQRAQLEITFEGETYYAGYAYMSNSNNTGDNIIATLYQLDLAKGLAAAANVPVMEYADSLPVGIRTIEGSATNYEQWTPDALASAQDRVWGMAGTAPATWFAMYPKYYILNSHAKSYFVFMTSQNGKKYHIDIINGAEVPRSTTITIDEVTFMDVEPLLPDSLKTGGFPYLGLFNLTQPGTTVGSGPPIPGSVDGDYSILGWNWQLANNGAASAATNWSVMTEIARDVGTVASAAPQP